MLFVLSPLADAPSLSPLFARAVIAVPSFSIVSSLVQSVAYAALAVAGAVLWKRRGGVAWMAVAIGFALVLLDRAVQLVEYLEINASLRAHPADTLYIIHHHDFLRFAALLGLALAAAGLVCHAIRREG